MREERIYARSISSIHRSIRKLIWALGLLLLSFIGGVAGYMLLEGYSLSGALYMTVITVSTVGYGEVEPLTEAGRWFTSLYIIFNLCILAYVISVITTYLFEGELKKVLGELKVGRGVKKLKKHVIVCGYGRNGAKACEELAGSGRQFVVIDSNSEVAMNFPENKHYHFILGDATTDDTLKDAGIERAEAIILTLPKDADNVFISLTARELNSSIVIISRASNVNSVKKLYRAGASKVVMPDALGGMHMAQLVTKPDVIEFLQLLNGLGTLKLSLDEFSFENLKSEFRDKTIRDLDIRKRTGATVIGFKDSNQGFYFNPHAETVIKKDVTLIVVGNEQEIENFRKFYSTIK
ncbi:potassium channel family protein [Xanthovirga aplysinae]|uniref:potassium channel family protein n=1 Tax=Xanthovirga aplysinae TaxID=2529853 RepID=UPI0012BD6CCF|nr:potassium channel protein [Xanthovirga aplysinae]MTI30480.1 potassium channel protein [Xanthovirga aplysinae]